MATINMGSIMNKVDKWTKSPVGQKSMADVIRYYRENGISKTSGGGFVFTTDMMQCVSEDLIHQLQRTATRLQMGKLLQPSVVEHFDSLVHSPAQFKSSVLSIASGVYKADYFVYVEFTDDLHRDSLLLPNGARTGGGIDNIIAMFEKGVNARGSVFGLWDTRGEDTWSLSHRPAMEFVKSTINRTIDTFNMKYDGTGCKAKLLW